MEPLRPAARFSTQFHFSPLRVKHYYLNLYRFLGSPALLEWKVHASYLATDSYRRDNRLD